MSAAPKFTPGPWRVYHGEILSRDYGEMVADLDNKTLVVTDKPRLGDFAADARLIAAAPELYEALEVIANAASVGGLSAGERKGLAMAAKIAAAALAKVSP